MTQDRPTPPPPSRPGRSEAWRTERMVQRVPAHLGEATGDLVSPWVMVAGVALLILVVCAVLYVFLGGGARLGIGVSATATPTRPARTSTPAITVLPVTLAAPSPSVGPTAATVKYVIKSGDTLIGIAAKYKVTVQSIVTLNGLKDETIRVGDELKIPLPTPTPPPNPPTPSGATPTPISFQSPPTFASSAAMSGVLRHVVKRGDTLSSIAGTYGSTIDAIRVANQLDSDFLSIGQELVVPPGSWTPTPTSVPTSNATATPTSQFSYAAPSLLSPADNATLRGKSETPMLAWTAPATLKSTEFYVVHIDYQINGAPKSIVRQVKQGTSARLDQADYPGANPNGTTFSWYVVIVNQAKGSSQVLASSPASPTWTFVWY
ncbi:MAG: LysM peptidoglycan-binding domain-containing protein [Chloroflexi bacterium]|nr:LysM peptidoglycan-binding domain-containing protein [Chloroflexota bacterium]